MKQENKSNKLSIGIAFIFIIAFFVLVMILLFEGANQFLITFLVIMSTALVAWIIDKVTNKKIGMKDKTKKWTDRTERLALMITIIFIISFVLVAIAMIYYKKFFDLGVVLLALIPGILFYVLLFLVVLKIVYDQRLLSNQKIMESFAKDNNFIFKKSLELESKKIESGVLNNGRDKKIINYIQGEYRNRFVEIYNYRHFFQGEKIGHYYEYLVVELQALKQTPEVIICPKKSYLSYNFDKSIDFVFADKLETESNEFNNLFRVFLKRGSQKEDRIKLLTVLTPDVIAKMIDVEKIGGRKELLVELKNNKIFILKNTKREFLLSRIITDKEELKELVNLAFEILEEI